jgi:prolyl-tRNA synthetase
MAKEKLVTAITSMNEDFAQWYTDVVRKPNLLIIQVFVAV